MNRILLVLGVLFLAILACSRAGVPIPTPILPAATATATVTASAPATVAAPATATPVAPPPTATVAAPTPAHPEPVPSPTATPVPAPNAGGTEPAPIGAGAPEPRPTGVTLEPPATPTTLPTPTMAVTPGEILIYYTQSGDTLPNLAVRFGVTLDDIVRPTPVSEQDLLGVGHVLLIPKRLGVTTPADKLIPDSELVFSANASAFDVAAYVGAAGGFLAGYRQFWAGEMRPGAEIVQRVAFENSVNPRLLLALLQYQSGWVLDTDPDEATLEIPMGYVSERDKRLYHQLTWAANVLNIGYYGWRAGTLSELTFPDASSLRLAPDLNAGTVALQYFFARFYAGEEWARAVSPQGFAALFSAMFGDPFQRTINPLLPASPTQPAMELPFLPGQVWSLTGGPHGPWERDGAWAALDFAPPSTEGGCAVSSAWVTAVAPGVVVRSGEGAVVLDLDGDGREQTGWALFYMHIASNGRAPVGAVLETGDLIGHPSCEGGYATGTHVHIARKFNGEWIAADGPIPFNLGGWVAHNGPKDYLGSLTNGERTVIACTCASSETQISR